MKRKVIAIILSICILQTGIAYANPISDRDRQNAQSQLTQSEQALLEAERQLNNLEMAIQRLDRQIEGLMIELDQNGRAITKSEADIVVAKKNVDIATEEIVQQQELFDQRMRAMYTNGSGGYLAMLLKAEDFSDLFNRVAFLERMIKFDKKVVAELQEKKLDLEKKQMILEEERATLESLRREKETKLAKLSENKSEQNKLLEEAKKHKKLMDDRVKRDREAVAAAIAAMDNQAISIATTFSSSITDIEAAIVYLNARIKETNSAKMRQAVTRGKEIIDEKKKSLSRGEEDLSKGTGYAVAMYAYRFLGTPYLWGGTRPYVQGDPKSGFDCSGLVQYCYRQFGISITRTTYTQIKYDGRVVSRDELKPGDLIFFGTWSDPGHVGMYVGNGSFIHAPRTGDVVKIQPLTARSDYLVAKRIVD